MKWSGLCVAAAVLIFSIYLSQPIVETVQSPTGTPFKKSNAWNEDSLLNLELFLNNTDYIDGFIATHYEKTIVESGSISQLINLHSARKPLISLLFGIARDKGMVDLNTSIKELGITEHNVEFSPQELTATIRDLLMSRSGIYVQADAETKHSKEFRPKRDQYAPGEYYFYNNFDFNVLGTILKKTTGMSYEECLYEWLAKPLEMQDFHPSHVVYGTPFDFNTTHHKAYKTWMSTRDLAKIGAMLANKGVWKGTRIISEAWINESTTPHHYFDNNQNWPRDGYAMLWAIDSKNNNIWGTGYGGQFLMVDTTNKISITQRHYTGNSIISQGWYLVKNTQSSPLDLMKVWYSLKRCLPESEIN